MKQAPRFPDNSGRPRRVEDKTDECAKWSRNGACSLDRDFNISTKSFFNPVKSSAMFAFMQKACMKTCGWAPTGKCSLILRQSFHNLYFIVLFKTYQLIVLIEAAMTSMRDVQSGRGQDYALCRDTSWCTPAEKVVVPVVFWIWQIRNVKYKQ